MRENKFKVWNKALKRFTAIIDFSQNPKYWVSKMNDDCIYLQYTGLKDKNGVEIYEGDIIIFGDKNIRQEVVFKDGQYLAKQIGTIGSYIGLGYCEWEKYSEVIGNIYENPELLSPTIK